MVNPQTKGKEGEREIARDLNSLVDDCLRELGLPPQSTESPRVQRNQNQSAVGGCDLVGTFGLAVEIKRQEQLAVNTWWNQCTEAARALQHHPVLIFRQNTPGGGRKLWRVVTLVSVDIPGCESIQCRAELSYDDFKRWFKAWALEHLRAEQLPGTRPTVQPQLAEESCDECEYPPFRTRLPDLFAEG